MESRRVLFVAHVDYLSITSHCFFSSWESLTTQVSRDYTGPLMWGSCHEPTSFILIGTQGVTSFTDLFMAGQPTALTYPLRNKVENSRPYFSGNQWVLSQALILAGTPGYFRDWIVLDIDGSQGFWCRISMIKNLWKFPVRWWSKGRGHLDGALEGGGIWGSMDRWGDRKEGGKVLESTWMITRPWKLMYCWWFRNPKQPPGMYKGPS